MSYWICPECGANLDPGEKCECQCIEMKQKKEFIFRLKLLLMQADVELQDLQLLDMDTVRAIYRSGAKRDINIAADSRIAIVRDVAKYII